ncbi:electron transfer flavoprotein subunit alpha/FixB family protein [Algivirga pacifica]|uniref:Electron transfer flavoprotein subunit alpha/FixB family protein n=1 Tax=Algivirga pacifica TaxID=1162670 RepID=A0ABP9CZA7_9BACT
MSVLVYVETDNGLIKKSSFEAVTCGKKLGEVTVVAVGNVAEGELSQLGKYGVSKVLHVADERLDQGVIGATATVVAEAAQVVSAGTVIMARSSMVDAVAPRVAVKMDAAVASNVVAIPDTSAGFKVKRGVFTGKAFAFVTLPGNKRVITLAKNAVAPEEVGGDAAVEVLSVNFGENDFAVERLSAHKQEGDILLPEADLVVSAGRGLKGPENWGMIEELAGVLGAATACSKPVSDMDWRPHHEHVGQTGIKVSPNLYIAVGISGAIQHLAGVSSSRVIVAINKDPEAPFFKAADYGVVGDAFEVVPKLIEALKN